MMALRLVMQSRHLVFNTNSIADLWPCTSHPRIYNLMKTRLRNSPSVEKKTRPRYTPVLALGTGVWHYVPEVVTQQVLRNQLCYFAFSTLQEVGGTSSRGVHCTRVRSSPSGTPWVVRSSSYLLGPTANQVTTHWNLIPALFHDMIQWWTVKRVD